MGNLADQNRFWLVKCCNWLENGRWPTVTSCTVYQQKGVSKTQNNGITEQLSELKYFSLQNYRKLFYHCKPSYFTYSVH